MTSIVVESAFIIQILGVILAVRLMFVSGRRTPWIFFALGMALLAGRGIWVLAGAPGLALQAETMASNLQYEAVLLVVSALLFIAIYRVDPLLLHFFRPGHVPRAGELRYRELFNQSSEGIVILSPAGACLEVNRRFATMVGQPKDDLVNARMVSLVAADDRDRVEVSLRELAQHGESLAEMSFLCKDRAPFPAEISFRVLSDGMLFASIRDISERKSSEEQLRKLNADLERRNLELMALYDVGRKLSATLDLSQIYQVMFDEISQKLLGAPHFSIAAFDPETENITCAYAIVDKEIIDPAGIPPIKLGEGPISDTIRSRQPKTVDLAELRRSLVSQGRAFQVGDERLPMSALYVPLISGDKAIGALNIQHYDEDAFRDTDMTMVMVLAAQASVAIENARLFIREQASASELEGRYNDLQDAEKGLRRQLQELTVLHEIARAVGRAQDEDGLIETVTNILGAALFPDNFGLLLRDESTGCLVVHPSYRIRSDFWPVNRLQPGEGVAGQVATGGEPLRIKDVRDHPGYIQADPATLSELCVPLVSGSRVLGVINAESTRLDAFSEADERLLVTAGGHIATALERLRLLTDERKKTLELARSNALITALSRTAAQIEAMPDPIDVMRTLGEELQQLGVDSFIALLDELSGELVLQYLSRGIDQASEFMPEAGAAATALRMSRARYAEILDQLGLISQAGYIPNAHPIAGQLIEHLFQDRSSLMKGRIPDWLGLRTGTPYVHLGLVVEDRLVGVMGMWGGNLRSEDQNALSIFGSQVAITIENARLLAAERERRRETETLSQATAALVSSLEMSEILGIILHSLEQLIFFDRAAVFMLNDDRVSVVAQRYLPDPEAVAAIEFPASNPLFKECAEKRQPVILTDASGDPRFEGWGGCSDTRGWMGIPLFSRGNVIGFLSVDSLQPAAFSKADGKLAQAFANQAAAAIENARLFSEARLRARHMEVLNQVIAISAQADDFSGMLDATLEGILAAFRLRMGAIWVNGKMACTGFENVEKSRMLAAVTQSPGLLTRPYQIEDREKYQAGGGIDALFHGIVENVAPSGARSLIAFPVGSSGGILLASAETRIWYNDETLLLEAIGRQLEAAVERLRIFEETQLHADLSARLTLLSEELNRPLSVHEVLSAIGRGALTLARSNRAAVYLRTADNEIEIPWYHNLSPNYLEGVRQRLWELPGSGMMKSVETLIFVDVRALPPESLLRQLGEEHHYLGISLWPLAYEGRVIAAIGIYSDEPRQWLDVEREVMEVFSKQAAIALQNARIYETSQRHLRNVRALRAIDSAITASMDLRLTLDVLLSQVVSQVSVDAAAVLLYNQHIQRLRYAADRGFRTEMVRSADFRLGEGIAGATAHDRRPVVIPDLSLIQDPYIRSLLRGGENFVSYIGLPLIAKGQVKGVLEIYNRAPLNNDPEWLAFLESIAIQAAIAVDNATMFEDLQRSNLELAIANDATLEGWARALELRDQETEGHSREVTEMTLRLARRMGMNESELVHIRRGALLHDIGKMGIPDSILLKPGPLSDEEWALMRLHPVYAYQLLSPIPFLRPALDIPYCHHERWDGGGYPRGLRGEQIPLAARIFTVVDVWSALKANRPYRTAWDDARTWAYLSAQAGSLFDPKIVEVFIQLLQESAEMANSSRGVKNH